MSVKTGAVGSNPNIDKLMEVGVDSLKNFAATTMIREIVVFWDTDVQEEYEEEHAETYAAAEDSRTEIIKNTERAAVPSELPDTGVYVKDFQDGNIVQRYKNAVDEQQRRMQATATLAFAEDYALRRNGVEENREEFFADYLSMESEYLVEGALLTCTQATDKSQSIPVPDSAVGAEHFFDGDESKTENPLLDIANPANDGNAKYATVSDTIPNKNIFPFRNCRLTHAGDGEEKVLKNKEGCMKYGTCYALMDLCNEWVNVQSGAEYGTPKEERKNCINMLSHLGCYQGGIIFPLDTGQGKQEGEEIFISVDKEDIVYGNRRLSLEEQKINARYIYNFLTEEGWSHNAICGMLGNWSVESFFSPTIWYGLKNDDINNAFGLAQWKPSTKLVNWANENGMDPNDIDTQLERILLEARGEDAEVQWQNKLDMSFEKYTQSDKPVEYLAEVFLRCYEKPEKIEDEIAKRAEAAGYWSDFFLGLSE